jgi:Uma2 family endonuclease
MATMQLSSVQGLVLNDVDWRSYVRLLRVLQQRRCLRLTYDRGTLEIMTISPTHERYKHLLGRLIEALSEELGFIIAGFGSMTCKRKQRRRGLEPDECYWIGSEPLVRGKLEIDLRTDPPPDLAVEIDVKRSSLDRLAIYAALGVPEVWRFDGKSLIFNVLGTDGEYAVAASSLAFRGLTASDLTTFLIMVAQLDENEVIRQFRAWVRQHFVPGGGTAP